MGVSKVAEGAEAVARLQARFADAVLETGSFREQHWAVVDAARWLDVARWLRDDASTGFDVLLDVTAVHWPQRDLPMEIVAHLYSVLRNDILRLKARIPDRGPIASLTPLWSSADWNEREAFDMFGIIFTGHPDLRRILMPEEYTDFPLRKELPLYRG
jgi:NADH-quinone oxidoreductase subunit C